MSKHWTAAPTRRAVSFGLGAALLGSARDVRAGASADAPDAWRTLTAAPAAWRLRPPPAPETTVWALDGQAPGPVIRVRHGEELRVRILNRTDKPLSFHALGLRGPNAMDGVGGLTQAPAPPGGTVELRLTPCAP